ncbi:MAG: hypothetical protein CL840_06550 [Crocinitomicaceae bacterium]|nr:hypothetical protein [Crocinitomicaceae bacterium]|tara:strand:+ start:388 stop:3708 length:3321 start_codon:yes stop_codon:yes gene_type:complete
MKTTAASILRIAGCLLLFGVGYSAIAQCPLNTTCLVITDATGQTTGTNNAYHVFKLAVDELNSGKDVIIDVNAGALCELNHFFSNYYGYSWNYLNLTSKGQTLTVRKSGSSSSVEGFKLNGKHTTFSAGIGVLINSVGGGYLQQLNIQDLEFENATAGTNERWFIGVPCKEVYVSNNTIKKDISIINLGWNLPKSIKNNFYLERVTFDNNTINGTSHCLTFLGDNIHITIKNNTVDKTGFTSTLNGSQKNGATVDYYFSGRALGDTYQPSRTSCTIENNTFKNCYHGLEIFGNGSNIFHNPPSSKAQIPTMVIKNNTLESNQHGVFLVYPYPSWVVDYNTFTLNQVNLYLFDAGDISYTGFKLVAKNTLGVPEFNGNNVFGNSVSGVGLQLMKHITNFVSFLEPIQVIGYSLQDVIKNTNGTQTTLTSGVHQDVEIRQNILDISRLSSTTFPVPWDYGYKNVNSLSSFMPYSSLLGLSFTGEALSTVNYTYDVYKSDVRGSLLDFIGTVIHPGNGGQTINTYLPIWFGKVKVGDRLAVVCTAPAVASNTSLAGSYNIAYTEIDPCAFKPIFSATPDVTTALNTVTFKYLGPVDFTGNYTLDFGDGTTPIHSGTNLAIGSTITTHGYSLTGNYTPTLTLSPNKCSNSAQIDVTIIDKVCCNNDYSVLIIDGQGNGKMEDEGIFVMNASSGEIVFQSYNCPGDYPFDCLKAEPVINSADNVVSANTVTLYDNWDYNDDVYTYNGTITGNDFEKGKANQWRVKSTFVYREDLDASILNTTPTDDYKNFDRGLFSINMFDWQNEENNDLEKWVKTNTILRYTPNGNAVEDENIAGIRSTALMGYSKTKQTAIAQNASFGSIAFENFERFYASGGAVTTATSGTVYMEGGMDVDFAQADISTTVSHTGVNSIKLKKQPSENDPFSFGVVEVTPEVQTDGLIVRMWVKCPAGQTLVNNNVSDLILEYKTQGAGSWFYNAYTGNNGSPMTKIANAGDWALYEGRVSPADLYILGIGSGGPLELAVFVKDLKDYGAAVYIDDIRAQPASSEMICNVFDHREKLVATFDDQHFALIYQYNDEGDLVKKLKETEFGIKTLSQSAYNTGATNAHSTY